MSSPHPRRWLILFVVLAAECMDLLDGTIVNVAAPTIHHELHASSTALQWIVGGYPLALAGGLLIGGRLGDVLGRRRMFLLGAAGFTAASTLAGLSPSTGVLIAARIVQGLSGAVMLPQGLGLIRDAFAPEEMAKAFGMFGPVMGSAAMIGPILGGGLIALDLFGASWRPVFLVNLPFGVAAVLAGARLLPRSSVRHAERLDLVGAVLAAAASLAIVYPLIEGRALGWPPWTYASMAGGVILFAAVGLHLRARRSAGRDPLVEAAIFASRGYSAGALALMLYFGSMVGGTLALTLFLQLGEHFSAIHAGLTLAPFALGTALTAPVAGSLMARRAARPVIQAGMLVSLLGSAGTAVLVSSAGHLSSWALAGPLLVYGLGMGLFIVPVFDTIIAAVTDAQTGSAAGALNAIQQLGGAIGVAVLGTIFFTVLRRHGFGPALTHTLWWQAAALGAALLVSPLLPLRGRPPGPGGAPAASGPQLDTNAAAAAEVTPATAPAA